jgi:hypothetical protein
MAALRVALYDGVQPEGDTYGVQQQEMRSSSLFLQSYIREILQHPV